MGADYLKMLTKSQRLPVHTDLDTLDLYCEYLLNYDNKSINFSNLSNLQEYFERISDEPFKTNESKLARYFFIKYYLEARLTKGAISPKICIRYVQDHVSKRYQSIIDREILQSIPRNQMAKQDVEFMNNMIFGQLNMIFMHDYKTPIMKILEELGTNDFGKDVEDCDNAIRLFQSLLNELTRAQRKAKKENRFNLKDEMLFNAMMQEAAERALSEDHVLKTGWQGLNQMINGGLEDARIYNFIGATGGFKSGLLLNLMKQIKKYNKGRPHKDPTKTPTILFISQENNIWETFLRLYGIFGGIDIKEKTVKEILAIMKQGGFKICEDSDDINIDFRYYANQEIGVSDIRGMIDELDNSGCEVICVIQDYIERLRPPSRREEKWNQLADVSNELHDLAVSADIPIVTASQFNRDGVDIIESGRIAGKMDLGKKVGSGNVSGSHNMLKNFDVNISIVVEYDSQEERYYLSFRSLKFRGDDTNAIYYFLQPFSGKNRKIQLMEDEGTDPLYRLSMVDEIEAGLVNDPNVINTIDNLGGIGTEILEPITQDPDLEITTQFLGDVFRDIERTQTQETDPFPGMPRDENGFVMLVRLDALAEAAVKCNSI